MNIVLLQALKKLYSDRNLCRKFGEFNFVKSAEYSIDNVLPQLEHIYTLVLGGLR